MTDLSHYQDADNATLRDALREFDAVLPPDAVRVALDVGSRDTQIARGLARHYQNARVWAFEPNPAAVAVCRENMKGEPRLELVEAAATDKDGPITFYPIDPARTVTPHADGNIGASSLYKANAAYPYETYAQTETTVHGTRLDTWAAGAGVDEIDVLWMDVQGAELAALTGLGRLLSRVKILHVEVQYKEMYVGASLFGEVDALLTGHGFVQQKKLYACEWFGDVVYVRGDLLAPQEAPPASHSGVARQEKTLVLEPQYGGLGDHLFYSHLPRIAKQFGGYDKVFISTASPMRHPDYKRLVWDANPFVDGFTHERGPTFAFTETDGDGNVLDFLMHLHGLEDGQRGHEPELYFQPVLIPELVGKTVYDPNFVSYVGDLDAGDVAQFFAQEGTLPDFQMAARGDNRLSLDSIRGDIETTTLDDFCSVLFSCKAVTCLASGTATLAAALGKTATVLHGPGQKAMFHHSPRHRYVVLPPEQAAHTSSVPGTLPLSEIYDYNQRQRDWWVAEKARAVPIGSRVLDVGAGTAPYRSLFAHCAYFTHDFKQYEGVKLGNTHAYADINYVSDVVAIPAPDASFDVILCTEVLEHVPEPIAALREMARLLRPGGTLLITAPLGSGLHQEPYHFYGGYTPYWYEKFCAQFGLRVSSVTPNGGFFKLLAQECARFSWTWDSHQHLHGKQGEELRALLGETLPRYLFGLDDKARNTQFTAGYFVEAVRPLPGIDWQEQIDRRPSDISLYREAAWAARAAGDEAAALRFTEDMEELDPDAVFVFAGGFAQ